MKKEVIKEVVLYWEETAKYSHKTMNGLFEIKRYSDSLFYGHIVLEKMLKAFVVLKTKDNPPLIHNLVKLAELAELKLSEEEKDLLDLATSFNVRCRYPDYKFSFYKKYNNKKETFEKLDKINTFYFFLCQELKQRIKLLK